MAELNQYNQVTFKGQTGKVTVETKTDTGADRTSIDHKVASKIGAGPVTTSVLVNDEYRRSVAKVWVEYEDFEKQIDVSISDRKGKSTQAIIGLDVVEEDGVNLEF
jgi:predicted aspartyl protease